MTSNHPVVPVQFNAAEVPAWQPAQSFLFGLARFWNRYAPRAKGAVPRFLGRTFGKSLRIYVPTAAGARLAVEPACLDVYVDLVNHGGQWNQHVLDTCVSVLQKGQVFWDIGANAGIISIGVARRLEGDVRIFSFEPQPALSHIVAVSAALNNFANITVFDVMLGDAEGEAELHVGAHTIHASAKPREQNTTLIKRRIMTIDGLMSAGLLQPPNVIKMDIEGGELSAFQGARQTIATHRPHIVFESDENMKRFGYARKDVLQLLSECAPYQFFFIDEDSALIPVEASNLDAHYGDILATIPKDASKVGKPWIS